MPSFFRKILRLVENYCSSIISWTLWIMLQKSSHQNILYIGLAVGCRLCALSIVHLRKQLSRSRQSIKKLGFDHIPLVVLSPNPLLVDAWGWSGSGGATIVYKDHHKMVLQLVPSHILNLFMIDQYSRLVQVARMMNGEKFALLPFLLQKSTKQILNIFFPFLLTIDKIWSVIFF